MKLNLTKINIDRIVPPIAPTNGKIPPDYYWDIDLLGFGLRVTPDRKAYIVQGRVRGTGRQVRATIGPHGRLTPDEARREARKLLGDLERGIDRNRQVKQERLAGVTMQEAYEAYVGSKTLSDKTRRDYKRALDVACEPWKTTPLTKITGGMVRQRFEEVSKDGPVQANQMFRFVRALLGWSMWRYQSDDGTPLLPANPCEILTKLKLWHRVDRRVRYVQPDQLAAFMGALEPAEGDSDQYRATKDLCALLILTGLREQEGCGLRWADVDLEKRVITVRHTKNHRDHTLPLGPWLSARLAGRRAQTGITPFVFPADNASGHLMNHWKHVLGICKAAGVEFRLHDLRRTFASIVNHHLERSLSQYTIKRLLNHASGGDVTAGYIQHPVEALREPMEMVETFVLRSGGLQRTATVIPMAKAA